jgi:hypothetical protein
MDTQDRYGIIHGMGISSGKAKNCFYYYDSRIEAFSMVILLFFLASSAKLPKSLYYFTCVVKLNAD